MVEGLKPIESAAEFDALIAGDKLVIVIFSAEWCGPCKMIKPYLSTLATGGDWPAVVFCVADVDALEAVAAAQGVASMPTTMAFKGGKKLGEVIGTSRAAIAELLATHGTA